MLAEGKYDESPSFGTQAERGARRGILESKVFLPELPEGYVCVCIIYIYISCLVLFSYVYIYIYIHMRDSCHMNVYIFYLHMF